MRTVVAVLGLALVVGVALSVGVLAASDDEAAVKKHTADFAAAWNKHDPKAMAALWADDGDLINPWGRVAKGRPEVEKLFADEQTGKGPLRDSTFELKGETVRFPTPDVAVDDWEISVTGAYDPDGAKHEGALEFHCTVVLKKAGGAWTNFAVRPYLKGPAASR
jgi:uncharacterized protein (TIGR02246 family)